MSKARQLADLGNVYDDGALSNRNLIINGAMQVAQRGTSEAGVTTSGYKTCDRWVFTVTNQGTWTVSQSSTTPNSDFSSSFKLDCTSADASPAASDQVAVTYRTEAQDFTHLGYGSSDAKSVTVSFWVRSSKTGTYTFEILASDPDRQISKTYTINTANTWEKKEITILGDTGGTGIVNDNGIGLILKWWLGAGSDFNGGTYTDNVWAAKVNANRASPSNVNLADSTSNDWYITGVQLEVGDTATPFEHRSYGDELARCQRYFYKSYPSGVAIGSVTNAGAINNRNGSPDNCLFNVCLPVELRAFGTATAYNPVTGASGSLHNHNDNTNSTALRLSDGTKNFALYGGGAADENDWLSVHVVVDAEL